MQQKYSFLICFLFLNIQYFSQIEITRNITVDDGLAYSEINTVIMDHRGILWVGTSAGLTEWDSKNFKNYYTNDGLPSQNITSISEDENNKLFVGTTKGLVVLKGSHFKKPENLPTELNSFIINLYVTTKNDIIVSTLENGLWLIQNGNFIKINHNIPHKKIVALSILENKNGEIIIGTESNGLFFIKNNLLFKIKKDEIFENYQIKDILQVESDEFIYALNGFGLVYEQENKLSYFTKNNGLVSNYINDLLAGPDNQIFVATRDGLNILKDRKLKKIISKNNGLINEFITNVYKNDNIYFLSSKGGGVYIYKDESFITYNKDVGLINNNVWIIHQDKNDKIYFGTDEGISIYDKNGFNHLTKKNGLGDDLVISVYEDISGTQYWGTHNNGVTIIKDGEKKILNKNNGLPGNSIWYIIGRENDEVYFITHKNGIGIYMNGKIIDTLNTNDGLPKNLINSAYKKRDGSIYVGVDGAGVYKLENNKFINYMEELDSCNVWSMFESSTGKFYLGTDEKGIIECEADSIIRKIGIEEGLSNNAAIGIVEDDFENLYVLTDKGLNILKQNSDNSFFIRHIFKQTGLASNEGNQGAIYKDNYGKIWVGTIAGVTRIDPLLEVLDTTSTKVKITSLKVFNREIDVDSKKELILDYDQNYLNFEYVGINYFEPNVIKYKYKLTSIDREFVITKRNFVQYTNLPAGKYTFEIAASNEWGIWSKPKEFNFTITQPFWLSWWFILLIVTIALSIILLLIYLRFQTIIKLERLRTKISADLHDELGSGLSEISILSELLKSNNKLDFNTSKGLEQIGNSTRFLIENLSDIIWIVNPQKETLKDVIVRIQNTYQEIFYNSEIRFNITQLDILENIKLPIDVRQNIYLVIKEAVNNSLKYSECKNIQINIRRIGKKLNIDVVDDGIGFDIKSISSGNGLINIKNRIKIIKGDIKIDSNGEGTKIEISIPL